MLQFIRFTRPGWQLTLKQQKTNGLESFSGQTMLFFFTPNEGWEQILVFSLLLEISAADIAHYHFG